MSATGAPLADGVEARPSVWKQPDFRNLWAANTVSMAGTAISYIAIALLAADRLGASPAEMGLLGAASALPALLVGPVAGVVVDRRRRRPIMIAADLGRALLLLSIPLATLLGHLSMTQLYLVAFFSGALTIIFSIADRSLLPTVLPREQLLEGNSALELGTSSMNVAGPAAAGGVISLLGAAGAVALDSLSYLISAVLLLRIRTPEPPPRAEEHPSVRREVAEGLRAVFGHRLLRAITLASATVMFFNGAVDALFLLFMVRELDLGAGWIGVIFAIGSLGFVVGALIAGRVIRLLGPLVALAVGIVAAGASDALVVVIDGPPSVVVPALIGVQFVFALGAVTYSIGATTLRQTLTPDHLLGRVNATAGVIGWGVAPLGALLGGLTATVFGLREALLVAAVGEGLGALWLLGGRTWAPIPHASRSSD